MAYIYKIVNKINDKVYVGQTTDTLEHRFQDHVSESLRTRSKNRPLYKAFSKYGIENFYIEALEVLPPDTSLLQQQEIFWIAHYKSFCGDADSWGYNATRGGDSRLLFDYDLIAQDLLKTGCLQQTSINCNCTTDTVVKIAKAYSIPFMSSQEFAREKYSKPVNQYDFKGNLLQTFKNKEDAERWIREQGISNSRGGAIHTHIVEVCKGKRKTAYGFIWKYAEA
jgi:group I intron endonuclease